MSTRIFITGLLALLALAVSGAAQQVIEVPNSTRVNDVTPDGNIIVGQGPNGAFIWAWRNDATPTDIGGLTGVAVSDDGTAVAGLMEDPVTGNNVAGRWTALTGWVPLGGVDTCDFSISSAYDISGDGTQVTGLAWDGCSGRAFLWDTTNGMQVLTHLNTSTVGGNSNRGTVISTDGSTVAGFARGPTVRTPAYWQTDTLGGAMPDDLFGGEVRGLSGDGDLSVGTGYFGGTYNSAFVRSESGLTGFIELGSLYSGWSGEAWDISEDGSLICGHDVNGLASDAWIWTSEDGIIDLEVYLTDAGAFNVPNLITARKMSDDGNVIVGTYDPIGIGFEAGYIAEVNSDGAWTDLGGGTAGSNGTPHLSGTGTLQGGTIFSMDLVNAPPFAQMLVWVSLTSTPVNAFGGTIHAFPPNTEFLFPANGAGEFHAASIWPTGIPAHTELYFQFLIGDITALPWGITISNGLLATTP
jgi:hypothetical protein